MFVSRAGFLLFAFLVAMSFGATAHAEVPTHHVTPALKGGKYRFHTADGHIRCELSAGAQGSGVNCFNGRRGAMLNWSGSGAFWPFEMPSWPRAGMFLWARAWRCTYPRTSWCTTAAPISPRCAARTVTHRGFMIGLVVARLV